jgi:(4-(4-[2-(gamma-L-glutamylamino)ethyl]phenoxymethyl)furan-2-yl)methanamine synthase
LSERVAAIFGWDVGGAHVKVSMADASGRLVDVVQWACPLWQGLDHLERIIDEVLARWPHACRNDAVHAITMTGEMVDLFTDRAEGVRSLTHLLGQRLGTRACFFASDASWLSEPECAARWREVASANWLATARWVATRMQDAVLVDIGSTTTDIVPIIGARVAARGSNDAERLASGELVYQGVVRTPLCGVAQRIEFRGAMTGVMNEWFATSADVYRLTGELWPSHDQHASADNGPKTAAASRARIARMIGRDAADASELEWRRFAQAWRHEQLNAIGMSLARVCAAHPALSAAPIVGAGCGRFLAAALARRETRSYVDFAALAQVSDVQGEFAEWVSTCAPSVSVALLAAGAREGIREGHAAREAG